MKIANIVTKLDVQYRTLRVVDTKISLDDFHTIYRPVVFHDSICPVSGGQFNAPDYNPTISL